MGTHCNLCVTVFTHAFLTCVNFRKSPILEQPTLMYCHPMDPPSRSGIHQALGWLPPLGGSGTEDSLHQLQRCHREAVGGETEQRVARCECGQRSLAVHHPRERPGSCALVLECHEPWVFSCSTGQAQSTKIDTLCTKIDTLCPLHGLSDVYKW